MDLDPLYLELVSIMFVLSIKTGIAVDPVDSFDMLSDQTENFLLDFLRPLFLLLNMKPEQGICLNIQSTGLFARRIRFGIDGSLDPILSLFRVFVAWFFLILHLESVLVNDWVFFLFVVTSVFILLFTTMLNRIHPGLGGFGNATTG